VHCFSTLLQQCTGGPNELSASVHGVWDTRQMHNVLQWQHLAQCMRSGCMLPTACLTGAGVCRYTAVASRMTAAALVHPVRAAAVFDPLVCWHPRQAVTGANGYICVGKYRAMVKVSPCNNIPPLPIYLSWSPITHCTQTGMHAALPQA
jgi:hypothetical protein